ncbi:MAG: dihydroorotase [Lentisphaeria bacterium]|nr:dihydroorotase [Lentisphaeria bacterium]
MTDQGLVFKGARVIDPANEVDAVVDVAVQHGVFVDPASLSAPEIIDLTGRVLAPGFVDMHVHLRDPGQTEKEDLQTATAAAAAGGFTTVVAMPNTAPVMDDPDRVRELLLRAEREGGARVLQTAAMTQGLRGLKLTDFAALKAAGAVALTDDGASIQDASIMREALIQAAQNRMVVLDHCEHAGLSGGGVIAIGEISRKLSLKGKPVSSEDVMIARNAVLANETGCPVHLQHVSTAAGIEIARMARWAGWPVTCEVTPHHFCLTDEAVLTQGANAKMNPPLRSEQHRQALLKGLCDGTVSVIATDHAPHTEEEKSRDIAKAPNGVIGLETAVRLSLKELYHSGLLELPDLIAKFTIGPCVVLGLPYGTLTIGRPADITILDLDAAWTIDVTTFKSKARNSPFDGWQGRGKAVGTLVGGAWVYRDC